MMKSTTFGVAATLVVGVATVLLPAACVGEDPPFQGSEPDAGPGSPSSPGVTGECEVDADCVAKLPETTPPGCATATCDPVQKKCLFKAKDSDGDGHIAKNCQGATAPIETGDDCDDNDRNTYPGAWDGPATDVDSGPEARTDRCDQRDNDCNGSPDDGKVAVDGGQKTCTCDPTAPLPCYEYSNGVPIDATTLDENNVPKGACKKGTRSCPNGVPGACVGAVGPSAEQCDTLDHDCDGVSGDAGDTVADAPTWFKDSDDDNYGDKGTTPKQQCVAPASGWKQSIPNTDCNDADKQMNPGLGELCDGKDNNCNGVNDDGYSINAACVAGTNGVCKRNGTLQCATTSTTTCSPGAGTASGEHQVASNDPLIYTGSDSASYTAAWDWDCSGVIEARPDGLINFNFAGATAASNLCNGNYQAACEAAGNTQSTCLPVVYPCGQPCGLNCTRNQACGKMLTVAYCLFDKNATGKCDTYDNAKKPMNCR